MSAPPSTATLTMRVTWQEDGAPASGIPVLCRRWTETGTFAVTDAAGEATFAELPPGDYQAGTHDWHNERVALAAADRKTVEHQLARGRREVTVR